MIHLPGYLRYTPDYTKRIVLLAALIGCAFATACSESLDESTSLSGLSKSDVTSGAFPVESEFATVGEPEIAPAPPPTSNRKNPRKGVVTAGDIDDTLNLQAFYHYQTKAAAELRLPSIRLSKAVQIQLLGPDSNPAPGVPVTLQSPGSEAPFYQGYSGVDGWVTAFPSALGAGSPKHVHVKAFGDGQDRFEKTISTGQKHQSTLPFSGQWSPGFLDLVFVFDTTGSMGDELAWLTKEFGGIVQTARRSAPGASIRYGLIAYRDHGDAYVVKNFGFTTQQNQMQGWLRSLDAQGGGDYPEAASEALQAAVNLDWRRGKGERFLFHIADAPPHKAQARSYLNAAEQAAQKNIQIFGLGASGVAKESEFLMRQAALVTSGRYIFLTDDSGVGYSHAEPTVACYRVTRLKSLLIRVLSSELSGHRKEENSSKIIREVGNYRRGVCLQ